jgi:hypothetical protein
MTRVFLRSDDVRDLVTDQLGSDRGVVVLDRLAGGSKKGVDDFPERQWNITKALAAI